MLGALALSPCALAADSDDDLASKATDPTASLMSFQLSDWYTAKLHDADGSINQVVARAAIPYQFAGVDHIFRITQPFVTRLPGGHTGFADTSIFDVMVFNERWGAWALGVAGSLPAGRDGLTTDKWALGPAVGIVNKQTPGTSYGVFVQSYFSFAGKDSAPGVGVVNIQPVLSQQLGGGRSIGLGSSALVYDTERSRWSSLLLSVNYGQIVTAWGHKWRPNVEAGYDFRNTPGNDKWVLRANLVLLLPK